MVGVSWKIQKAPRDPIHKVVIMSVWGVPSTITFIEQPFVILPSI